MTNPNAESQQRRRDRLTAAARVSHFETVDQWARAVLKGTHMTIKTSEYSELVNYYLREHDGINLVTDEIAVSH